MAEPMYRRIAEELQGAIESGELRPGSKLPTESELRERYPASRNTIRDAIRLLTTRGLVESRAGAGTFVVETLVPFVIRASPNPAAFGFEDVYLSDAPDRLRSTTTMPRVEIQEAGAIICEALWLPAGEAVASRHFQQYIEGTPWSLQTSFYPMGLVERGGTRLVSTEEIELGVIQYLAETLNIRQAGYSDRLAVRQPDANEADFFHLPYDGRIPVIETIRTGYDQNDQPFRVTVSVFRADRNQFMFLAGAVPEPRGRAALDQDSAQERPSGERIAGDRIVAAVALER